MRVISEYEKEAADFLKAHNAKMTISHKPGPEGWRRSPMTGGWLYRVRIDREGKSWSFDFSDSQYNCTNHKRPGKYDVLACITKYEPYGDEWDFADEYGYQVHNRETYRDLVKTFEAVKKEYANVMRMFGDCIEELAEIC